MPELLKQLSAILTDLYDGFIEVVPQIIFGFIFLLIGWLFAKMVAFVIRKILEALNLKSVEDSIQQIDLFGGVNFKLASVVSKTIYWVIMLIVFMIATELMGLVDVSSGFKQLIGYIPRLLSAAIFFIVGAIFANIVKTVVDNSCRALGLAGGRVIASIVFYFILIMVGITSLNQAGLDTQIITQNVTVAIGAVIFAFAIGYGFASKDIMANVLASFYSKGKFKEGQVIKIGDVQGRVTRIDGTSLVLRDNGKEIIIPLHSLITSTVEILEQS